MTASRDPDRLIRAFLDEGPTDLSDRSYDAVRSHIDPTRQRVVIGPWREPRMSNIARWVMVAAAVVVVAVVGYNLLPRSGGVGGQLPSPSPSPSPTLVVSVLPSGGPLAAGSYSITDAEWTGGSRMTLTVPAGWTIPTSTDAIVIKNEGKPGEVLFTSWVLTHIEADACQWSDTTLVNVGTSVDQLVTALGNQKSRQATTPSDVTVGGFAAKRLDLTVPPTLDVATCSNGVLRYWPGAGPDLASGLCCNPAGNTDEIYVVDAAGKRPVIVARFYPGSTAADKAELQSIVDSVQITP
jgi:hypothetical protein